MLQHLGLLAFLAPVLTTVEPAQSKAPLSSSLQSGAVAVLSGVAGDKREIGLEQLDCTDPRTLGAWQIRFRGVGASPPAALGADAAEAELWSGERLAGKVKGGAKELFEFELGLGVRVSLSLEDLKSLRFPARVPELWGQPLVAASEGDRLYRRQKDVLDLLEGGIESFSLDTLSFHDSHVGSKSVAWADVAALFVDPSVGKERAQAKHALKGVPVVLDLVDSSRLRGGLVKIAAGTIELEREGGEILRLPAAAVALLLVDDGRLLFLSDLVPTRVVEGSRFGDDLGLAWPHRGDRAASGGALVAAGSACARGIGAHAPSTLGWTLDGTWKELRGSVAVDDSTLRLSVRGSVVFRVLVDGEKRWESPLMRGGDAPLAFPPIALGKAQALVLEADGGGDGFIADRADWLELVLSR